MTARARGWLARLTLLVIAAATLTACEPTLQQATGVVLSVDSPALGRVDSFELLTRDGARMVFDTHALRFRPEFPAPHLSEHQVLGDLIVVTYRVDGGRLIVTQLDDDAGGAGR